MKHYYLIFFLIVCGACSAEDNSDSKISNEKEECVRTADMPKHYKMGNYRGPTPDCVPNGVVVNTESLQQLISEKEPVLIDVLSVMRRPESDFGGAWLPNKERLSLPKAQWLPNVGYGYLDDEMKHYFRR